MDVLLAVAGTLVVLLVCAGMLLVTPRGTRPVTEPAPDDGEAPAPDAEPTVAGAALRT